MIDNFRSIFRAYGGWNSLWRSSYIRLSAILTIVCFQIAISEKWTEISLSVLPSMLGFSIAAIAIVTVIGDDGFRKSLSKVSTISDKFSDLESLMASFVWFIIVQVSTVIYSVAFSSKPYDFCKINNNESCRDYNVTANMIMSYIGTFFTIYSILLVISSTILMFQLFRLYIRNIPDSE